MSCDCNHKQVETQYIGDVQIDVLSTLPEYLLAERDVEDELSGDTVRSLVRIPTSRVVPNDGDTFTVITNNSDLEVPERQVRCAYVSVENNLPVTSYASLESGVDFLLISVDGGKAVAQKSNVITFPNGHDYTPGQQYYVGGTNGDPITDDAGGTAQKVFKVISSTQLLINM